jgi:hypothetical protein
MKVKLFRQSVGARTFTVQRGTNVIFIGPSIRERMIRFVDERGHVHEVRVDEVESIDER